MQLCMADTPEVDSICWNLGTLCCLKMFCVPCKDLWYYCTVWNAQLFLDDQQKQYRFVKNHMHFKHSYRKEMRHDVFLYEVVDVLLCDPSLWM